jgi:CRISPR-associated protein Csx10
MSKKRKSKHQGSTPQQKPTNMPPSLPSGFKVQVEMLSDWHIGSGAGRSGEIDSLVKRDHNDLPYIPAKTLTGIWRDACELVAQGLDNNQESGIWQEWVHYLFGDQPADPNRRVELSINQPIPASLSIRAAHLPESLSKTIHSKHPTISRQLTQAITFIKPGIKIDVNSGCAEKDCLRLEEQVRMGAILTANCTLKLPEQNEQQQTAYALLIAGATMVERLGGNRRRGGGKCGLKLLNISNWEGTWLKWLENPASLPKVNEQESRQAAIPELKVSQEWVSVPLQINLRSPLIISKRTVGNVVETLDYIPGTHLLRLVARRLEKLGVDLRDFITNGDLLVTNGTLEIDGEQGKPVPFALFYEKLAGGFDKRGKIYNRLVQAEPKGEQLKGYRGGYIKSSSQPKHKTVPLTLGTHNTIEDSYQRPTREVGGVYSYEAIKTGTIFRAELRLRQNLAEILKRKNPKWWEQLQGNDSLGQSKKDDYGNVKITVPDSPKIFNRKDITPKGKLYIWLLSDLLLRDKRLRPTASVDDLATELSKKLGVEVTFIEESDETLNLVARQNRLDSWQVRWGLPRPSLVGFGAGTCVVFNIDKSPSIDKLVEIEAKGIGERRAEGYGQLYFNHPLLTQEFTAHQNQEEEQEPPKSNMSNTSSNTVIENEAYARQIETAAWREEIQRQALAIACQPDERKKILGITIEKEESKPPMSQLGALRSVVSRVQSFEDSNKVINWIQSLSEVKSRKEKWNKDSLDNIKKLLTQSDLIWQYLKIADDLTLTNDAKKQLQSELWAETVRTLINTCIVAHKRDLEKTGEVENG